MKKKKVTDRQKFGRLKKGLRFLGMEEIDPNQLIKFYVKRGAIAPKSKRMKQTHDQISFSVARRQLVLKIHTAFNPTLKDENGKTGRFAKGAGSIRIVVENAKTGKTQVYRELWKQGDFISTTLAYAKVFVNAISHRPRCPKSRYFMNLVDVKGVIYWQSPIWKSEKRRLSFELPVKASKSAKKSEIGRRSYRKAKIKKKIVVKKTRRQIVKPWKKDKV